MKRSISPTVAFMSLVLLPASNQGPKGASAPAAPARPSWPQSALVLLILSMLVTPSIVAVVHHEKYDDGSPAHAEPFCSRLVPLLLPLDPKPWVHHLVHSPVLLLLLQCQSDPANTVRLHLLLSMHRTAPALLLLPVLLLVLLLLLLLFLSLVVSCPVLNACEADTHSIADRVTIHLMKQQQNQQCNSCTQTLRGCQWKSFQQPDRMQHRCAEDAPSIHLHLHHLASNSNQPVTPDCIT
jgi:hypothetical protein